MEELKIEKGLIKFNTRCFAACSGAFVLIGTGIANGLFSNQEATTNYFLGGILGINAIICAKMSYDCHKSLKIN